MKTCATCLCWRKTGTSPVARRIVYDTGVVVIPPGDEGQCRTGAPRADFTWPLTSERDWCMKHCAAVPISTGDALDRLEQVLLAERDHASPSDDRAPRTGADHPEPTLPGLTTLDAGTPGAASPAAEPGGAGTKSGSAADDTENRQGRRARAPRSKQ